MAMYIYHLTALAYFFSTIQVNVAREKLQFAIDPKNRGLGYYNIKDPISGVCRLKSGDEFVKFVENTDESVSLTLAEACGSSMSDDPLLKELKTRELYVNDTSSEFLNGTFYKFTITIQEPKIYSVYCNVVKSPGGRLTKCETAVMYDLTVTSDDDVLNCELKFGYSEKVVDYAFPSKVQWFKNGKPLDPVKSKSLSPDDFTTGNLTSTQQLKSYKYPLQLKSLKSKEGLYECQFIADTQMLTAEYSTDAIPVAKYIRFDPDKEQFADGKSVDMTCAFGGYPKPNITWQFDGMPIDVTATESRDDDGLFLSTIHLEGLENTVHRGNYSCKAVNDLGSGEESKLLRVRDKLAPLWPFLGIVVQVVILAICIAVGEKIRKKKYAEKQRRQQFGDKEDGDETRT